MNRIADARPVIASVADAIRVHADLAQVEIRMAVAAARTEKAVAELKAKHMERIQSDSARAGELREVLAGWIMANKPVFAAKRKIVTDFGSFGLQSVSELQIADEPALVEHLLEQGYEDCLKVVRTPIKPAIKARIEAGETMPGCHIRDGDTAVYKVSKTIIEDEVSKAVERE